MHGVLGGCGTGPHAQLNPCCCCCCTLWLQVEKVIEREKIVVKKVPQPILVSRLHNKCCTPACVTRHHAARHGMRTACVLVCHHTPQKQATQSLASPHPCALCCSPQVPVKKHHFLPLKIAGAVAKAVLSNMEGEAVVAPTPAAADNVTEEVTYEPAPAPVVASAPVPTFPAGNDTNWNTTVSWSG